MFGDVDSTIVKDVCVIMVDSCIEFLCGVRVREKEKKGKVTHPTIAQTNKAHSHARTHIHTRTHCQARTHTSKQTNTQALTQSHENTPTHKQTHVHKHCHARIHAPDRVWKSETSNIWLVASNGVEAYRVLPISANHGKR